MDTITMASFSVMNERKGNEMEKIKMDNFAAKICAAVKEKLGYGYKVEIREVKKNNSVILHGLVISTKSQNVAPTIYLESFWESYGKGINFTEIIHRILAVYQRDVPVKKIDMDFFRSFIKVKDRICYRLINRKGNEALLEEIPHTEFLDLAVCFYYAYQGAALGEGTILIHNSHLKMWNTTIAELYSLARDNTPRLFPWMCQSMGEVIHEIEGCMEEKEIGETQEDISLGMPPMKVLSNQKRVHGAVCIRYPGVLEEIAEKEGNLYILPSSIHEVILLPDDGKVSAEELKKMIHEVNTTQVAPEEVLSDSLYYYNATGKEIVVV